MLQHFYFTVYYIYTTHQYIRVVGDKGGGLNSEIQTLPGFLKSNVSFIQQIQLNKSVEAFQLNIRHKDATVSQLATTVVYKIYWPLGAIQCSREYKKFLKSISIHFNSSFMQLKQTSGHKNIPLFCSPSSMVMLPR